MEEKLIKLLTNIHEAKTLIEINDLMGLKTPEELKELQDTLNKLISEYKVFFTKKEKYILLKNCPSLKIGPLSVNKKGFGFVILSEEDDIYIDKTNLKDAIDEDIVLCEVTKKTGRKEGKIVKVIKRDLKNVVGEIIIHHNQMCLKLDDDKKDITVILNPDTTHNCVEGHKVLVEITERIKNHVYAGDVLKIIGHKNDPQVDILSIAYKYGIYEDFNPKVEEELEHIPNTVDESELKNRRNLTAKTIFTIDGDDTKDIDDAISLEKDGENYILGVHIADVSNYVKENTALGDAAYERGTSSYLADTVIPMIPHKLSNGICSLNEGVIRLSMSCVMKYNTEGKLLDYDIFPSYIKSSKKMTYKNVNKIIMENTVPTGYEPFADTLKEMHKLAKILRKMKEKRGYIDFDLDEVKIIQDEKGHAIDVQKRVRGEGEKLIEDFMIAANECVASHIYNMGLPFIYRVHENPKPEKIEDFMNMINILGYRLHTKVKDVTPYTMQKILAELKDKKEFEILSEMLLRSMRKAEYSSENLGHFGIASRAYTHFTSPIRRYPDLVVHRLLKKYLVEDDYSKGTIDMLNTSLSQIAAHSSEREVAAVNAERDVDDMKMAEYMENHIGEEYIGKINTITSFGFFVELDNLVEGLVHISSLKKDYFNYVPELLSLVGKNTKKTYRLGDKVKVKCVAANKETAMIDFEIVEEKNGNTKPKSKI